jgi:hypothetical protein
MLAVTDQPDAQRGAGRPDPDVEASGWLASALSGLRRREQPASGPDGPMADGSDDERPAEQTDGHGPSEVTTDRADRAVSPLGVPPLPTTPTGVVRWWTAGATLAAGALLAVTAYAGTAALVVAGLFVVAVTAWGWPRLIDSPSPRGSLTVVAAGGAGCVLAVGLTEQEPLLQWLALALAGAVVLEFLHQLTRRDGRPRLVECVTATLAGVVVLASMSSWVALPRTTSGAGGVLVAVVPLAVGLALQAWPVPARIADIAGVVASAVLAGLIAGIVPEPTVLAGLVTGLVAGVVGVMLHRLLAVLPPAGSAPAWLAVATAPLASTGMVSYVALRLLVG